MFEHFSEAERKLLHERAKQIAANKQDDRGSDTNNALRCRIGNAWYAIPLAHLSAIYKEVAVIPIPSAPSLLSGVANIRGRIIPVLDMEELLNQHRVGERANGELVVIEHPNGTVALQVWQVDDVLSYREADLEAVPEDVKTEAITAVLADGTLLLDTKPLLDNPDLVIDTQSIKQRM